LKIVNGFKEAKSLLTRQIITNDYPVTPSLKQKLWEAFGTEEPEQAVRQIIEEVRSRGDNALFDLTLKIDGIKLESLEVNGKQIDEALKQVDSRLMAAL
jgi:histidinol dehydrogenase